MADTDPQVDTGASGTYLSERHRNPAEMMVQKRQGNDLLAGICAILATLVFLAMLGLLWTDWTALQAA